jgi:hypothetical protein
MKCVNSLDIFRLTLHIILIIFFYWKNAYFWDTVHCTVHVTNNFFSEKFVRKMYLMVTANLCVGKKQLNNKSLVLQYKSYKNLLCN